MVEFNFNVKEFWSIVNCVAGVTLFWNPGCIVEIGTSFGDPNAEKRTSTNILGDHAKRFNRKFYTCDIRKVPVLEGVDHIHFGGPSSEFIKQFDADPVVVFLDGCHHDDVLRKEVLFFINKLRIGGIIFMHDMFPFSEKHLAPGQCSTAYLVRQELERDSKELNIDVLTFPYSAGRHGMTLALKHDPDRLHFRRRS